MDQVVLEPPFTDSHQSTSTMAPISSHKAQGVMSMESSVPSRPKLGCRLATPSNDDLVFDHVDNCLNTMQQQQQQIIRIRHSKIGIAKRRLPRARATATLLFSFQSLSSIFPILLFFIHLSFFIFSSSHPSQPITPTPPSLLFLQSSLSLSFLLPTASAYQVTWNNGPEDNYFCGMKWDDPQPCSVRQNCRTGKHEECEGFAEGEKCFAFTDCDSKAGGGHDFVPKIPDETPTVEPTGSRMPSLAPLPPGPTKIPTEMPIGPPPPLDRSDDPTDYWFCGIGIDDTNQRCETHCPTASECPMGEICYFGTRCDARTHAPTPPPTRRPTDSPTPSPTASPTASDAPSWSPTASSEPSVAPTKQGPTRSPTRSPTKRPTWAPLTDVQTEMFCGLSWQDVTSKCRERCPSGEDTECPEGFFCFAYTGCQEEKGYPEDEYQHLNGHGDEQSEGDSGNADGKDEEKQEEEMEPCVPFQVTITPDNWPQEISWTLTNEAGEVVADDGNEEMTKGKPYVWLECVPRRECYEFKIMDSGGDGLCCDHGDGNYKVDFDEQLVKVGAAFYNDEIVEVGVCGETAAPTKAETASPTIAPTIKTVKITKAPTPAEELNTDNSEEDNLASAISPSGKAYRCVASQLVDSGYALSANMCDKFDGCYNEWIGAGDDWFCEEGSQCVVAPACGANSDGDNNGNENDGDSVGNGNGDEADTETNTNVVEEKQNERPRPSPNPTPGSATRPKRTPNPTREVVSRTKRPTPNPVAVPSRPQRPVAVIAPEPTSNPTNALMTSTPTKSPTATPSQTPTQAVSTMSPTTIAPTLGPCDGDPCPIISQCRSQFGFCGPDELYCNERSIWTEECGTKDPTPSPIVATIPTEIIQTVTTSPVQSTTTKAPTPAVAKVPFFKKPSGGGKPKPSGGKPPFESVESSNSVPTRAPQLSQPTDPPQSIPPTVLTTWIIFPKPTPSPTPPPTPPPTPSPTLAPNTPAPNNENYVVLNSSDAVSINMITNSPTAGLLSEGALDSNEEENDSDEDTQCSGDPCPVASHCRSRYGSCGPGFIYCNQYTIWTSACPAKPTKKPTSKPTKSPSAVVKKTKSPVASPAIEPPKNEPTLPTLPKPTLPHLTEPLPVELPDFASAAHSITADGGEDEESGNDDADDDDTNEEEDDLGGTAAEGENNMFTSDEYLTEWNSWKKGNSGFKTVWNGAVACIQIALLVALSIMSVLC